MTKFLADKMTAVTQKIGELADASGYGQFVNQETRQDWAAQIVAAISEVEQRYGFIPLHQDGTVTTQIADANAQAAQIEQGDEGNDEDVSVKQGKKK